MVGKPVFFSHLDITYGAWLRDPIAVENVTVEKIWQTNENDPRNLYEYKTKYEYVKKIKPKKYPLPCIFKVSMRTNQICHNHFILCYFREMLMSSTTTISTIIVKLMSQSSSTS